MDNVIQVKNLSYKYTNAKELAINNISFDVKGGEILGIVGPNGSGKSTLLKLLSGILKPFSGKILLLDEDISRIKQKLIAQKLAVVPQNGIIGFPFTAQDIVLMGRSPHLNLIESEKKRDFEVVKWAMEQTNSFSFRNHKINELSGGERQRVFIARALAQEPTIMLLDEPTSHLDLKYQIEVFDLIRRLNRENQITVVVVSHDLNLAGEYCERLILLKNGIIFNIGAPEEVITEDIIKRVYDAETLVSINPMTGSPHVTLVGKERAKQRERASLLFLK